MTLTTLKAPPAANARRAATTSCCGCARCSTPRSKFRREERDAWIEAHVADPEERVALARLLDSDDDTSGFFETPAGEHVAGFAAGLSDDVISPDGLIGTRVGAFRR